mgnify:FL=1
MLTCDFLVSDFDICVLTDCFCSSCVTGESEAFVSFLKISMFLLFGFFIKLVFHFEIDPYHKAVFFNWDFILI